MDKAKKKKIRQIIGLVCAAVIVVMLAVLPLVAGRRDMSEGPEASILSGTVASGSIETVLVGGGTLAEESAVSVTVPAEVKLTEFLVANGDTVLAGDAIATVDRVTVMTAMAKVQETLDYLAEQIEISSDTETVGSVISYAGGTVKILYAEEGKSVQDAMLEDGALAVLSLDGLMAVKFETDSGLSAGKAVTVTLSDGTKVTGRVKSNLSGTMIVTVEDQAYIIGETVAVADEDGELIGEGELYINSEWKATAYTGTVSELNIAEGDTVKAGDSLMELSDTGLSAEYQALVLKRQEYEALMQELLNLYQTETVYAPCDGVISGVDESSTQLLENSTAETVNSIVQGATGQSSTGQSTSNQGGNTGYGDMGGMFGDLNAGDMTQTETAQVYDLSVAGIASVIPQDSMTLSITVDELDILALKTGMEATVTVDAINSKSFTGIITDISNTGTNNGGNSKFTVELTLERAENMLSGMNAVATVILVTTPDVISIPVDALVEHGTEVFVYTGYDEDSKELLNPVSVTVGVSDGKTAEILSGLSEGTTYYYAYYDTLTISNRPTMGGGGFFGR